MVDKFTLYRFIAPLRSRLQNRLRRGRSDLDVEVFARRLEGADGDARVASLLWHALRDQAFVQDFRPDPDDSLSSVYAMGPEEVRDDVIEPLLAGLGVELDGIDLAGFDFASIATPNDIGRFVLRIAAGRNRLPE